MVLSETDKLDLLETSKFLFLFQKISWEPCEAILKKHPPADLATDTTHNWLLVSEPVFFGLGGTFGTFWY